MRYDAMKRQAGRPSKENACQLGTHLRTDSILAELTGESARTIQRYISLTNLTPELLEMVDTKQLAFNPAVELSYITTDQQKDFLEAMDYAQTTPSLSQAQRIKKLSQDGLFRERMQYLLKDEADITAEITALTENKSSEIEDDAPDYDAIKSTLERMTDFSEETLDHDMLDPFIEKVVVKQDREFAWYINLSGQDLFSTKAIVEGRKKKATVSIDGGGKSFFVLAT